MATSCAPVVLSKRELSPSQFPILANSICIIKVGNSTATNRV
ncbi:hypothetical protein COI_0213 [Mannheimia haemolytica serotype A2 str. OVINE]|nr:hypothetical protein COI_0213 [Mannheimia haemolytica serotype A2 str. OVINE]